ncbi:MAG TPA: DUF6622 family protein [Undibacterium sp.]|jgi:hypothetical protein|nr:DUF6622 family protein [Undibacterium sp.]HTD04808.1 DUF6622 family protein [Undibacterium sp.]
MLQQIIIHTPIWVWAILAFLIYRGVLASKDRELGLRAIFVIPLVMLALSMQGIAGSFGFNSVSAGNWLAGVLAGSALSWKLVNERNVTILPHKPGVLYRGSWGPMLLMMAIFLIKYCVNVMVAMNGQLHRDTVFVALVCLAYGLCNGLFLGKMLRVLAMYKQQAAATLQARI